MAELTTQQKQARQMVEELLCLDLAQDTGERTFDAREGYRTVFTGIFSDVSSVTVDGVAVTDYYPAFFDKRNSKFYNSIVFKEEVCGEVIVDADWGFNDCLPADLQALVDKALLIVSQTYSTKDVKSKKVEDFSVVYGDLSDDEVFVKQNALTIRKYSMCDSGYIVNGETCHHGRFCGIC